MANELQGMAGTILSHPLEEPLLHYVMIRESKSTWSSWPIKTEVVVVLSRQGGVVWRRTLNLSEWQILYHSLPLNDKMYREPVDCQTATSLHCSEGGVGAWPMCPPPGPKYPKYVCLSGLAYTCTCTCMWLHDHMMADYWSKQVKLPTLSGQWPPSSPAALRSSGMGLAHTCGHNILIIVYLEAYIQMTHQEQPVLLADI